MMEVALHIPDNVAKQMRQGNRQDITRHILEGYAIRAYQERTLGESHLRRLLGLRTRDELEAFFAAHRRDSGAAESRSDVGGRVGRERGRLSRLFSRPPSEPDVRLSPHPA